MYFYSKHLTARFLPCKGNHNNKFGIRKREDQEQKNVGRQNSGVMDRKFSDKTFGNALYRKAERPRNGKIFGRSTSAGPHGTKKVEPQRSGYSSASSSLVPILLMAQGPGYMIIAWMAAS